MKTVKVLGAGCAKCEMLYRAVETAARENGLDIGLEKVTDIGEFVKYGVMMTPALVVDGQVKASGKIPGKNEIIEFLT
jgi:small redox-active disulfide protein 2